jgi:hypothetical protein
LTMSKIKAPRITPTNLYVARRAIAASPDGIIRQVAAVDAPHVKRCIDAGLLVAHATERGAWTLTDAGQKELSK